MNLPNRFPAHPQSADDLLQLQEQFEEEEPHPAPEGSGRVSFESQPGEDTRRIPHVGHALLFSVLTGVLLLVAQIILAASGHAPATVHGGAVTVQHPKLQLAALAGTYTSALVAGWFLFPALWGRSFLDGLSWNWNIALGQAGKLIGIGLLVGAMVQVVTYFATMPKTLPIDEFFSTRLDAWLITLFGTLVAPVFEEICFRGFLVPAFAIAYDWLSLPRTPEARLRWQTTATLTPAGLIFSAVLTSILFALLHAQQVAHAWVALLVLFSVSLVLTFVRVRTRSVAASAMVHGAYNSFVFLTVLFATGGYRHLERLTQ